MKWSVVILVLLAGSAQAVNNFTADANCIAVYRFENGALTVDSKGGNTLTPSASPPTADLVNFQEGACAADFERSSSQEYTCADASLDAAFPGKNGDNDFDFSVTFFFKPEGTGNMGLIEKSTVYSVKINATCIYLYCKKTIGVAIQHASALTAGTWYFIACTIRGSVSNGQMLIHVYDVDADAILGVDKTGVIGAQTLDGVTYPFDIAHEGVAGYCDGILDEVTIWNKVLTGAEITEIREGTFGGGASRVFDSSIFDSKIFGD